MNNSATIHPDLLIAAELAYKPSGLFYGNLMATAESQDYGACSFEINDQRIKFRVAKITPKKIGQFVTFWKRIGSGPIEPYDVSDPFDLLVISVRNGEFFGQFVFPKSILYAKGFISKEGRGGKRAMRVYPPWDTTISKQAKKTQLWQIAYFFEINPNKRTDHICVQSLFNSKG